MDLKNTLLVGSLLILHPQMSFAKGSVGSEGASFLEIPVGAEPAALGGAYSARAQNAYAPIWNPAGLGFSKGLQIAGQHLSYLESIRYEFASISVPLGDHGGVAIAGQYLGSGDVVGRNDQGDLTGDFTNYYAAYTVSVGHSFGPFSIGLSGKMIDAKLSDVHAQPAYAGDLGLLYKVSDKAMLSATVQNVGTRLKFIDQEDELPAKATVGLAVGPFSGFTLSMEGVYRKTELTSAHAGAEWRLFDTLALRAGYRTDLRDGLDDPMAGVSAGIGVQVFGQEFSYAWVPYGPLGQTQYFSMLFRLGGGGSDSDKEAMQQMIQTNRVERYQAQAWNAPARAVAPKPNHNNVRKMPKKQGVSYESRKPATKTTYEMVDAEFLEMGLYKPAKK